MRSDSNFVWWMVGVCSWGFAAGGGAAQAPEDAAVPTLHAYTDLVQVPTLVLGKIDFKPATWLDEKKFFVRFDGGPKFRVTHARLEGDDPLSVAILLDANRASPKVANQAIASLAPASLRATDAVSIYAMDCQVFQAPDEGSTDAATLKRKVDLLLGQAETAKGAKCQKPAQLLDTLAVLVQALSAKPGRRVILAVTDGVLLLPDPGMGSLPPPQGLEEISNFHLAAFLDNGSLEDVAKATGGKAHFNNDLEGGLRDAATTGADYYALSYVPPLSKYDEKYHTIEVKVDRPGVHLEYRRGYTSVDIEKAAPSH